MKLSKILNNYTLIIFVTISLLSLRWILSYLNFPDEDIALRVMSEIDDSSYFPLINSFSNLDFNPSYNLEVNNLKLVSFPILSLLPSTFFFKIFGSYSFIIIEFIAVFLFLLIFYKIFFIMGISNTSSIFLSLIFFSIPFFLSQLSLLDIELISKINLNFSTFYNLRHPRPLISNLYLFIYLYYLIKFFYLEERSISTYIIISIIIGFSLHAFFYFFIFEIFLLVILYLVFFKNKIFNFIELNLKSHLIFSFILLFFIFMFFLQLYFSEYDYRERMGIFYMDFEKKKIVINYLFNFFTKIEFILLFASNTFFLLKFKNKIYKIFYYFFISTIFSTTFFIFFSPSSMDYYHFFNWILASGAFSFLIGILFIIKENFQSSISQNKKGIAAITAIFLIILNYNFFIYKDAQKNQNQKKIRTDLSKLISFIKLDEVLSKKNEEILTLSYGAFIALVLNDYKNFYLVPSSFWTPKKTAIIENELISAFKHLSLTDEDFLVFFENKIFGYRYSNKNTKNYFDRLYLANKLKTYNNISNFDSAHKDLIDKTSILYSHQTIIPNNEFFRLKNKFIKSKRNVNSKVIILDNLDSVINRHYLDNKDYCLRYINNNFLIYVASDEIKECILINDY